MNHIKRKYILRVDPNALENLDRAGQTKNILETPSNEIQRFVNDGKEKFAVLTTENNELAIGFVHEFKGNLYAIPEPDAVLVYFNNAQKTFKLIDSTRMDLFAHLGSFEGSGNVFGGDVGNKLYDFMYASTSCIIFLFTAIEAMVNKMIPIDYVFRKERKDGPPKLYDFEMIQRLDFKTKLGILDSVLGKSFNATLPVVYQSILDLKGLRDNIVHSKRRADKLGTFGHLFKESLSFNYENAILAVRDFINFYQPNWVEPCNCGRDF